MPTGVSKKIIRLIVIFGVLAALLYLSAQVFPVDLSIRDTIAAGPLGGDVDAAFAPSELKPEGPPVAVVRLSMVLPAHPRWQELRELEGDLVSEYARAGQVVPAESVPDLDAFELSRSLQEERDRLIQEYQKQLEVQEKATWAQVSEQIDRKKAQLARQLEAEVQKKRQEFTAELAERSSSLSQEFQVKVLSLRLKLELLKASDGTRSKLTKQINELQTEAGYKLGALEKEYQARADDFRQQADKRYTRMLEEYANELLESTERQLEGERHKLETELANHVSFLVDTNEEPQAEPAQIQQPRLVELAQGISTLRGVILGEIREAGEAHAFRAGLGTVILTEHEVFDGVDISQDVIREIAEEGSLLREAGKADNTQ